MREFDGEMQFITFATTSMDGPTAPKKHSLGDCGKLLPIALLLHQHSTGMAPQDKVQERCGHVSDAAARTVRTGERGRSSAALARSEIAYIVPSVRPGRIST